MVNHKSYILLVERGYQPEINPFVQIEPLYNPSISTTIETQIQQLNGVYSIGKDLIYNLSSFITTSRQRYESMQDYSSSQDENYMLKILVSYIKSWIQVNLRSICLDATIDIIGLEQELQNLCNLTDFTTYITADVTVNTLLSQDNELLYQAKARHLILIIQKTLQDISVEVDRLNTLRHMSLFITGLASLQL